MLKIAKSRIEWEKNTVSAMIKLYCKHKHSPNTNNGLCPDCAQLVEYSYKRLDHCKFGENKTVCGQCSVHCYKPDMRDKIRKIMRYSGPKMIIYHPVMGIQYLINKKKGCKQ